MNWDFFLVWKQTGYFYQFKLIFFPSFWARAKYFDGPCLTIFPFYNLKRYTLPAFGLVDSLYPLLWIKRNENLENSISVHFGITFLTTLTGILDFANLIFQTGIFSQFKLGKKSNWIFQTGDFQKLLKSQCR